MVFFNQKIPFLKIKKLFFFLKTLENIKIEGQSVKSVGSELEFL